MSISLLLLILAVICWFMAALPVPVPKISIGWLGMFLYGLSMLVR